MGAEHIIEQADSIYKICDMFIYKYGKGGFSYERCWECSDTGEWYDYDCDFMLNETESQTVKGAIWTDKGLIFVAKLNDKGELELL